ncbi:hypothetical protein [Streptomyces sp. NBC_01643]|nr:hypothetical protein OHB03_48700 [Streptomyces sp. NBC_01643]
MSAWKQSAAPECLAGGVEPEVGGQCRLDGLAAFVEELFDFP